MNLKTIKKVELHRHLEGSVRFSTLIELAKNKKLTLPFDDTQKLKNSLLVLEPMKDLASVLNKFWTTQSLLDSEAVYERLAFECCEDAYTEGVRLLELRYSPSFATTNHPQLTFDKIHRGILTGIDRAKKKYPMGVGVIGIIGRTLPLKEAQHSFDFIFEHKKTFIGIDLADNEDGFDCKLFSRLFEKARDGGLRITIHAGEINSARAEHNVIDAIDCLNAERIGHGVQIYKNNKIMDYVKSKNIALELCPLSNWLTNAVSSHAHHPFRKLMEYGIKTTINSDDPGIFGSSLLNDYELLAEYQNFTETDFKLCNQNAFDACFIPDKKSFWPQEPD